MLKCNNHWNPGESIKETDIAERCCWCCDVSGPGRVELSQCTMMVQYPVPSISPWVCWRLALAWEESQTAPVSRDEAALYSTPRWSEHTNISGRNSPSSSMRVRSRISGINQIKDNFLFRADWGQWPWSDCGRSNFLCEISRKLFRYKQGWGWNDQRGHQINCVHG